MKKYSNLCKYKWLFVAVGILLISTIMILVANCFSDNISSIFISFGTGFIASSVVSIIIEVKSLLEKRNNLKQFRELIDCSQKKDVISMYFDFHESINKIFLILKKDYVDNLYDLKVKSEIIKTFNEIQDSINNKTLDDEIKEILSNFEFEKYEKYLNIYNMFELLLNSDIFKIEEKKIIIEMNIPIKKIKSLYYQLEHTDVVQNINILFDLYKTTLTLCEYYVSILLISKVLTDSMLCRKKDAKMGDSIE